MKRWLLHHRIVVHTLSFLAVLCLSLVLPSTAALAADPTIATGTAADTTDSSATLWGSVTSFGDYSDTYVYLSFDYATEGYYNAHGFTYDRHTDEIPWEVADGVTEFSTTVTGLPNFTTFHYRAKIRFGNDYAYGSDAQFTTSMLDPDSVPDISVLKAYTDLLEDDDCLFVILADIPYSTVPEVPVSRAFFWSLLDNGSEVGWNTGYAMNDNGYNFNVYSLYFAASDNIDWGNETDYDMILSGSPDVFSGVVPSYTTVDNPHYHVYGDAWLSATDYHEELGEDLLEIASKLEQEWQVVLLDEQDSGTVLSSNGEKLFRNAIPGVQAMAPKIFFVQRGSANVTDRSWDTDMTDLYKARLLGADEQPGGGDDNWSMWGFVEMADWLNIPFLLVIGFVCVGVCVFVIYKSVRKWGTPVPGYMGSLIVILCFGMLAMGLTVIALIGLVLIVASGWFLFMRKA